MVPSKAPIIQDTSTKTPLSTVRGNAPAITNSNKRVASVLNDAMDEENRLPKRPRAPELTPSFKPTPRPLQKPKVAADEENRLPNELTPSFKLTPRPLQKPKLAAINSDPRLANHLAQPQVLASSFPDFMSLTLPPDAQDWMRLALKTMQSGNFGDSWSRLVVVWFRFEERHGFKLKGPRLDAANRPRALAGWIQHARKNFKPDSRLMSNFEVDFWRWWNHVQPAWRVVDAKSTPRKVEGGWGEITKPGLNGVYTVMGALYLWRSFGKKESLASWTCAVEDVNWVLSQLLCV